jgi:hypothetical protein
MTTWEYGSLKVMRIARDRQESTVWSWDVEAIFVGPVENEVMKVGDNILSETGAVRQAGIEISIVGMLNDLGYDGWELVSVSSVPILVPSAQYMSVTWRAKEFLLKRLISDE